MADFNTVKKLIVIDEEFVKFRSLHQHDDTYFRKLFPIENEIRDREYFVHRDVSVSTIRAGLEFLFDRQLKGIDDFVGNNIYLPRIETQIMSGGIQSLLHSGKSIR